MLWASPQVVKFLVSDWGNKVHFGIGLWAQARQDTGTGRAGSTTLCQSRLSPPVRDYEFSSRCSAARGVRTMNYIILAQIH